MSFECSDPGFAERVRRSFAAQPVMRLIGADLMLNDKLFLNGSIRYIDIKTNAELDGASIGKVNISPWVYSINVGFRF